MGSSDCRNQLFSGGFFGFEPGKAGGKSYDPIFLFLLAEVLHHDSSTPVSLRV
jgi:hypothetical protein